MESLPSEQTVGVRLANHPSLLLGLTAFTFSNALCWRLTVTLRRRLALLRQLPEADMPLPIPAQRQAWPHIQARSGAATHVRSEKQRMH